MLAVVLFLHLVRGDHFIIAVGLGLVSPCSVAVDNAGDFVVATGNQIKRCPSASPGTECETVVGIWRQRRWRHRTRPSGRRLLGPVGYYVIADTYNNRVQRCVAGILHARCGTVTDGLNQPYAVVMDGNGDYVISDTNNHRVRLCDAGTPSLHCQNRGGIWFSTFCVWRIWCQRVELPEGPRHR